MSIATELGRVGIYNKDFPSIKPPGPLITLCCKVKGMFHLLYNYYHKVHSH